MHFARERIKILIAVILTLPWFYLWLMGYILPSYLEALIAGMAVISASFLLSWAAETAEMDVPRSFSLAVVALLAVLPEYAVDMYFAWMAGKYPGSDYVHYATANMTGANRLLIGLGWSAVMLYVLFTNKKREIQLDETLRLEVFFLFLATLYAFILPFKGDISLFDTLIFVGMYIAYIKLAIKAPHEEFEPEGVPAYLCSFPVRKRRGGVVAFFLFSAFVIFISVEAFAEGLLGTAEIIGLDPFIMVQWIAPLASEAPEFIVAFYLARKMRISASLNALISSKVNQWTLLIGTIALVYSISYGSITALPLDVRQSEEVLLTAAQSLFATAVILNLRVSRLEAFSLLFLFVAQLLFPGVEVRIGISIIYILISIPILLREAGDIRATVKSVRAIARQ
jgi:cation:H+ antiporter